MKDSYINQITQILHKVLVNGRIRRLQAQLIFIFGFQSLQSCIGVFVFALEHFLLDELVLFAALQLLFGYRLLDLDALIFGRTQLLFGLFAIGLVVVVRFHGGVQLLEHPEDFLVGFVANFATLKLRKLGYGFIGFEGENRVIGCLTELYGSQAFIFQTKCVKCDFQGFQSIKKLFLTA
jgi:hypothetical protein